MQREPSPHGAMELREFLDQFDAGMPWHIRWRMPFIAWQVRRDLAKLKERRNRITPPEEK